MTIEFMVGLWGSDGDQNEEGDGVSGVHHTKWVYQYSILFLCICFYFIHIE